MKRCGLLLLFLFIFLIKGFSNGKYPPKVEKVLNQTQNRVELEKAIDYFIKKGNELQIKAIYFLISNMDIHSSQDYYWADQYNKTVSFNELSYSNFAASAIALDNLKKSYRIHAVKVIRKDIDYIKANFLIQNVEYAFSQWQSQTINKVNFDNFCEYILPYRVSVEPLQTWRNTYLSTFQILTENKNVAPTDQIIYKLADTFKGSFTSTFLVESRSEPLPRLGALQLLFRKKGACEDIADMETFILRALGLPATVDFVPYWSTSSGGHFFNASFSGDAKPIPFDVFKPGLLNAQLSREPGKVLRITYSKQKTAIASSIPEVSIPNNFLRLKNIIDVTSAYWPCNSVSTPLFDVPQKPPVAYLSVFNYCVWRPVWWGWVKEGNATFDNMSKGTVYLPTYFLNNKTIPAGYPIANGYHNHLILKPDLIHLRTITINEQANYLIYKPSLKYSLYYWDNGWKLLGSETAQTETKSLNFNNVPSNALLLLLSNRTQFKERPFIITDSDQRIWF